LSDNKTILKDVVRFFCDIQSTRTKEEAFLKGVLFESKPPQSEEF